MRCLIDLAVEFDGARSCVVDYPNLSHVEVEELWRHAMDLRRERGLEFRK